MIHNNDGFVANEVTHEFIEGDAFAKLDLIADQSCRLVITSPPYNIGKEYERDRRRTLDEYIQWLTPIVEKACDKVTDDGHLCWQVGNYVSNGEVFPLDYFFYEIITRKGFKLRNRIIWHFNFGLHAKKRFSGRYETLLWFSKSDSYFFQLEEVLVPQLYPGKRHAPSKGAKAGMPSGNPKGKNPTDYWTFDPDEVMKSNPIWDLPNVKANHPEKTVHPCQFPSELVERCVLALTEIGDTILDPFVGTGTSVIAAAIHGRRGIGIDQSLPYIKLAEQRLAAFQEGRLVTRPIGKEVRRPKVGERVATIPDEWAPAAE
ncbi:DNA adenine methyltransferase YhdJ [Asticcacaulis sp. MM231]|uniref:DNA-methyltransferase n=1 Tax=Asticcacaulis sp. MM231 TaxID=3157666 RepID=UPI0032D57B3B